MAPMRTYDEAKIWGILAAENADNHLSAAEVPPHSNTCSSLSITRGRRDRLV